MPAFTRTTIERYRSSAFTLASIAALASYSCNGDSQPDPAAPVFKAGPPVRPASKEGKWCQVSSPTPEAQSTLSRLVDLHVAEENSRSKLPPDVAALILPTTIQVWVHVINVGPNLEHGNVPDAMVMQQIQQLNNAYSGARGGVDTQFRFQLAGITRTTNAAWFSARDNGDSAAMVQMRQTRHMGGATTLNLYIDGSGGGSSTFPVQYSQKPNLDWIAVGYLTLQGADGDGDLSMVAVHETGHWLGLMHVFEGRPAILPEECPATCSAITGDFVSDTPDVCTESWGCPVGRDTCPNFPGVDPIDNYMNYTTDSCQTGFTALQATRMRALWQYFRLIGPTVSIALVGGPGWSTVPVAAVKNGGGTEFAVNNAPVGAFGAFASTAGVTPLAGDFNGDLFTDIVLMGGPGWLSMPTATSLQDGNFYTSNHTVQGPAGPDWNSFAATASVDKHVGDFNGDGRMDVALTGGAGWNTIPVAQSFLTGGWTATNHWVTNFGSQGDPAVISRVGDFNADGKSDIVLLGNPSWTTLPVAFSNGIGEFIPVNMPSDSFSEWSSHSGAKTLTGDFDGDGMTDLALVGGAGWTTQPVAFARLQNPSSLWFDVHNGPITAPFPQLSRSSASVRVADANLDGRDDLILLFTSTPSGLTSSCGTRWDKSVVALSNGNGTWTVVQDPMGCPWANWQNPAPPFLAKAAVGDFDHDQLSADILLFGGRAADNTVWPNFKLARVDESSVQHGNYEDPVLTMSGLTQFNIWASTAGVTAFTGQFWHPKKHVEAP